MHLCIKTASQFIVHYKEPKSVFRLVIGKKRGYREHTFLLFLLHHSAQLIFKTQKTTKGFETILKYVW